MPEFSRFEIADGAGATRALRFVARDGGVGKQPARKCGLQQVFEGGAKPVARAFRSRASRCRAVSRQFSAFIRLLPIGK